MVVVEEEISNDGDLRGVGSITAGGHTVATARTRDVLMKILENISFNMSVGPIEIQCVVVSAEKYIIQRLENRTGTLATGEVDHISSTQDGMKNVSLNDHPAITRHSVASNRFGAADRWKHRVPHHKGGIIQRDDRLVAGIPTGMLQGQVGSVQGQHRTPLAGIFNVDISQP